MKKQLFTGICSILFAYCAAVPAYAQTNANAPSTRGFYGGVSLRDAGADSAGVNFGSATSVWNRYTAPTIDDSSTRSLLFGGYRWGNDVAVEAAFNASDKYALRSPTIGAGRGGVGLALGSAAAGLADVHSRTWNMDVYTSWAFYKAFALYGRLGVGQTETTPLFNGTSLTTGADSRRLRDGVNYGVGLRYDVTPSLGLRLEYARFGRFAGDVGSALPESDKVTFGVQFRF
jgi:hypothetical protein